VLKVGWYILVDGSRIVWLQPTTTRSRLLVLLYIWCIRRWKRFIHSNRWLLGEKPI